MAVEAEVGIGEVVDDHEVVLAGEVDGPPERRGRRRARGVVGERATITRVRRHSFARPCSPREFVRSLRKKPSTRAPAISGADDGSGSSVGTSAASPGRTSNHIRCERPSFAPIVVSPRARGRARRRSAAGTGRRLPCGGSGSRGSPSSGGSSGPAPPRSASAPRPRRRHVRVAEPEIDDVLTGPAKLELHRSTSAKA